MKRQASLSRRASWLLSLLLVPAASGCAQLVEGGLGALAREAGGDMDMPASSGPGLLARPSSPGVASTYQSAPTHDWTTGQLAPPFAPAHALFNRLSPTRVSCQAVPVGLGEIHTASSDRVGSPLVTLGRIELGLSGPEGVLDDVVATSRVAVGARAMRSGAHLAGRGPLCGHRFNLYLRIGGTPDPVLVHR